MLKSQNLNSPGRTRTRDVYVRIRVIYSQIKIYWVNLFYTTLVTSKCCAAFIGNVTMDFWFCLYLVSYIYILHIID